MKKQNGITIISLVVTIIILIILAGVSINLILGKNGIITIAKQAKENTELAKIEEETALNELYMQIEAEGIDSEGTAYDAITKLVEFKREIASAISDMGVTTSESANATTMASNIRSISGASSADKVSYDNTNSGLTSTNVQGAIDEINNNLPNIGNTSGFTNEVYNTIGSYLQYCIDNGYLPDIVNAALIPKMTSNTAPSGVAKASSTYNTAYAYQAFDGVNAGANKWASNNVGAGSWIYYKFETPKCAIKVSLTSAASPPKTFRIQASNDGSEWTDISNTLTYTKTGVEYFKINPNRNKYLYYRLYCDTSYSSSACDIYEMQLYGPILD